MKHLDKRFPKKRAFITGGASGLGLALSKQMADRGWTLVLADVNADRLSSSKDELERDFGSKGARVLTHQLDVTDVDAYRGVAQEVLDELGGIDVVINNAGVATGGEIDATHLDDWHWVLDINLRGVVHGCRLFVEAMKTQQSGQLINTASAAALFPVPGMSSYCVSKAAVLMLSEVLHNELHEHGVGVSCIMPEFFQTNLLDSMRGEHRAEAEAAFRRAKFTADDVARYALEMAGKSKLYVIYPRHLRPLWQLRRSFPEGFHSMIRKMHKREKSRLAARAAAHGGQPATAPTKPSEGTA